MSDQGSANWNALLRWSLQEGAKTSSEDENESKVSRTFTKEEREWFYNAMSSGLMDEVKRMKEIVEALRDVASTATQSDVERAEGLLSELAMRCESVDNAGDLCTIGGFEPLIATLRSEHGNLRAGAAEALATTTQNHEKAQAHALSVGAMAALVDAAQRGDDDNARAKALYALSCLVRGNGNAQKAFALGEGVQICAKLVAYPGAEKVRVKALVLARHVISQTEANMACAIEFNIITAAASCLQSENVNAREPAARLLLEIARCCDFEKSPKAVDDFRRPSTTNGIAAARARIAALTDEDDIAANIETKIALDSLASMFA